MAQNVGIRTNTPVEKLDVTGNIDVAGNIKLNSVGGQKLYPHDLSSIWPKFFTATIHNCPPA